MSSSTQSCAGSASLVEQAPALVSRQAALVGDNYVVSRFDALPLTHRLALARFLGLDRGAWHDALVPRQVGEHPTKRLLRSLPEFEARYGATLIGHCLLDAERLKAAIMQDLELADYADWAQYHQWYLSSGPVPDHGPDERWPVVLASDDSETLQDGWHRLHCYLRRGDAQVPAVFLLPRASTETPQPR